MFVLDLFNTPYERALNEGAVDDLEARHIHGLNTKMLDLMARAKDAKPEMKAALKREYDKIKAERDEFYKIKNETMGYGSLVGEAGIGQDIVNRTEKMARATPSTPASKVSSTVKNAAKWLAGKGGPGKEGPTYEDQKKNSEEVDEGWSDAVVAQRTGRPRTPYSVYIKGKKWKDFENDDHAEAVANKLRAKFKQEGRDPSVITIAATDYDKDLKEFALGKGEEDPNDLTDEAFKDGQRLGYSLVDGATRAKGFEVSQYLDKYLVPFSYGWNAGRKMKIKQAQQDGVALTMKKDGSLARAEQGVAEGVPVNDLLGKVTKDANKLFKKAKAGELKSTGKDFTKGDHWTGPDKDDPSYTRNFGHGYPNTPDNRSHDRYVNKSLKKDVDEADETSWTANSAKFRQEEDMSWPVEVTLEPKDDINQGRGAQVKTMTVTGQSRDAAKKKLVDYFRKNGWTVTGIKFTGDLDETDSGDYPYTMSARDKGRYDAMTGREYNNPYSAFGTEEDHKNAIEYSAAYDSVGEQGVAEDQEDDWYDEEESDLRNGSYVVDTQDPSGEVYRVSQYEPGARRCWIGDRDGRGWYISPDRLEIVDDQSRIRNYFGKRVEEGDIGQLEKAVADAPVKPIANMEESFESKIQLQGITDQKLLEAARKIDAFSRSHK